MKARLAIAMFVAAPAVAGCASLSSLWAPEEARPRSQALGEQDIQGLNNRELELRVAKLWAKVDELESEVIRQKERQHILEKGIRLGIVPEELKDDDADDPILRHRRNETRLNPKTPTVPQAKSTDVPKPMPVAAAESASPSPTDGAGDEQAYQTELAKAQSHFNAGKYGEAILAYEKIGRDYPVALTQGNHKYWIGLSWFYLKDYFAAKGHLENFVKDHGQNPWVPRARLYLALVDKENGLLREAQGKLKALLKDYPDNDVADVAKLEMKKLEEQL